MSNPKRVSKLFFLLILSVLTSTLMAQEPPVSDEGPHTDRKTFVSDILGLVKVGLPEDKIIAYWNKKGWPKAVKDIDFVLIRNAGAGKRILKRLRGLLKDHSIFSELADKYQSFEATLDSGMVLSMLRPKNWHLTRSETGDRFAFHEYSADLPGWFRRTSMFVWVFDGGKWKKRNEKALTRIVLTACKKRLIRGGLTVGLLKEGKLLVKRSEREFPVIEAICRDPKDNLKGVLVVSAVVDEKSGNVVVIGYSTRLSPKKNQETTPKDILTQMLDTVRIKSAK